MPLVIPMVSSFERVKKMGGTHPSLPPAGNNSIPMEIYNVACSSLPTGQSINLHVLVKYMAVYKITCFLVGRT